MIYERMSIMMKRNRIILMIIILALFFSFGGRSFAAYAATDGITMRLNNLKTKFPNGKYWNHLRKVSGDDGNTLMYNFDNSYSDCISDYPCATHNGTPPIGQYDCNAFDGAIQCYGFANKLFYEIFGLYCSKLTKRTDKANISIGDHIRISLLPETGIHSRLLSAIGVATALSNGDEQCLLAAPISNGSFMRQTGRRSIMMVKSAVKR